jgi:hypothetical protein
MTKDAESAVTTNMPAACDILLDYGNSALDFSEPVSFTDSAKTIPYATRPDHLDPISSDM